MKVPDLKGGQMITVAYFVAMLIVLFVVYKTLKAMGLIKPMKRINKAAEELRTGDIFDPDYYKTRSMFQPIGGALAAKYAKDLRVAMRGFGTDEETIYSTFGKLLNKTNISEIADQYRLGGWGSLQVDLLNELTDNEQVVLINIINKLPNT